MSESLEAIFEWMALGNPPPEGAGLFGATVPWDEAQIHIIGVPWDVTTSYGNGTAEGPEAVCLASHQLDLEDYAFGPAYRAGIASKILEELKEPNSTQRSTAERIIQQWEQGQTPDPALLEEVNQACLATHQHVYDTVRESLEAGKYVGLLGGDHSTPFGAIRALAEGYPSFGILHIDAHHDFRVAYEGFTHSHASIFYNVMENVPQVSQLVSVGIRDFSSQERQYAKDNQERVVTFYDEQLFAEKAAGVPFHRLVDEMLAPLPEHVYISVDIDGLAPEFAPNTGTPVPGGLTFSEMTYLLRQLGRSGKKVIGFDLVEVAPGQDDEWDANVGARLLYKLCGVMGQSNGLY